ncbi:hypothetical protein BDW75DRAFT_241774 [Aspergillus navahoensis]
MAPVSEYEYIIVGSGAGGGPLAANLARHGHSVLLLKAGKGENLHTRIPAFHAISSGDLAIRWDFFVQHYGDKEQAARNHKMTWTTPDGQTRIGTGTYAPSGSKQNGIYHPSAATPAGARCTMLLPPDEEWEHIANLTGDRSWVPKEMRKPFERVERGGYLEPDAKGHGFDGYLEIFHPDPGLLESVKPFLDATLETTPSKETGVRPRSFTMPTLQTAMAEKGPREYLVSTANATNPDGSRNSDPTPKATGVELLGGAGLYGAAPTYDHKTRAETKRDGIGPKDELQIFDIPIVADLPGVRNNPQDNYETHVLSRPPASQSSDLTPWCSW